MDGARKGRHRFPMAGKLMTQAELMVWEQKSRRWVLLGLIGLVTGIFGLGLLTLDVSYRMLKHAPVMMEALARISADPKTRAALGVPVRTGWAVTGELEDLPDQGKARMEFSLHGPRGRATVKLRAEKKPTGVWRYLLLEVKPWNAAAFSCADP